MTTTIGSQTNVPDPGSPITSPWAQDTARKLVHPFTNTTNRDGWTTRPDGAMAVTTDTDTLWLWNGSAWVQVPNLTQGDGRWLRNDAGPYAVSLAPGATTGGDTSGTMTSWLSLPNVTVPSWAATAVITAHVTNISRVSDAAVCLYGLAATLTGTAYSGDEAFLQFATTGAERREVSWSTQITPAGAGARAVVIGARRASGTGQIQIGTTSRVSATVSFR